MTTRKVVITKQHNRIMTCLVENDEIIEIHCADVLAEASGIHALGNIYVGKVKNIVTNINAAFIEIEPGAECYYDMSQAETAVFTHKGGKKPLCIGDELLVQISREAVKTKAPTVTSNLSFTGKYVVLTSGNSKIGISVKINKALRQELKSRMKPFENEAYGFVVRTNAKDAPPELLEAEIRRLQGEYETLTRTAHSRTCFSCLKKAPAPYLTDLKNVYAEGLTEIVVDDDVLYTEIGRFLEEGQPDDSQKLRLYKDTGLPLGKLYSIDTVLDRALKEKVWLKTGGYLVIQPTEALTVIDVNSGKCVTKKSSKEAYFKINLEAAAETAKQIRLRNLSGIILIDFINMDEDASMTELLREFRAMLAKDPMQTVLVDVTKLQLVEVTRKKIRRPLHECL